MCKVISEFSVDDRYKILSVDEKPPVSDYKQYQIGDRLFDPIPVNDMPFGIAIMNTRDSLVGKEVLFV